LIFINQFLIVINRLISGGLAWKISSSFGSDCKNNNNYNNNNIYLYHKEIKDNKNLVLKIKNKVLGAAFS